MDLLLVGKVLQPAVHGEISNRPGKQICDKYQQHEFFSKRGNKPRDGCSKDFSHADLLCPPFRGEGCEAEETEARDENRKRCENPKKRSKPPVVSVLLVEAF